MVFKRNAISLGSDEATELTASLAADLRKRGTMSRCTALNSAEDKAWPVVSRRIGEAVSSAQADCGIVYCWTGTGVSIAANKVLEIRAALCGDAETAAGARKWNDANVLPSVGALPLLPPRIKYSMPGSPTIDRRSTRPGNDRSAGMTP